MTDPIPKTRWFRLTPDRCVLALLALEGFLLLSAWFRWFPFNQHKGWSVLICLAAVGAALVLMFLWFLAALVFRWRFQFGILSLLLLVVAVAVPCSWLATEMKKAKTQREAVAAITRLCKTVQYDYQCDTSGDNIPGARPPGPQWFRNLLGEDFFASVVYVDLSPGTVIFVGLGRTEELRLLQEGHINDQSRVTDADLKHLNGLTELLRLNLNEAAITDAGLETLTGLTQLQELTIRFTEISGPGLEHLKGLRQLRRLTLYSTQIADTGLGHLTGLTQLQSLDLGWTQVSDNGLMQLKGLTQLRSLVLDGWGVTDAGLEHLTGLTQLQTLDLISCRITDRGLERLKGLTQLEELDLRETEVTKDGLRKLQQALPNCQIKH